MMGYRKTSNQASKRYSSSFCSVRDSGEERGGKKKGVERTWRGTRYSGFFFLGGVGGLVVCVWAEKHKGDGGVEGWREGWGEVGIRHFLL